jgi:hypothetical protein
MWWQLRRAKLTGEWTEVGNRRDEFRSAPGGGAGRECLWPWTRPLAATEVCPALGQALSHLAARTHPVVLQDSFVPTDSPRVSFLLGHRGLARLPHLLLVLRSLAGQKGSSIEVVVVEQSSEPELPGKLPGGVRYFHQPCGPDEPYNRSQTFLLAAQKARAPIFCLHDGDFLVPSDYASSLEELAGRGYEVMQVKRFLFYLQQGWEKKAGDSPTDLEVERVVQNLCGGGSLGITQQAWKELGGMDPDFVGWGGEDEEFWDRAQTRKVWNFGFLPFWHLWHSPQPGKQEPDNPTRELLAQKLAVPREERIRARSRL